MATPPIAQYSNLAVDKLSDLMLGAPSEVDQAQLDELFIRVVPPKKPS